MAENPHVNKVVYGDTTLIDISDTTAEQSNVLQGKYFYNASGAKVQGTAITGISDVEVDGTSVVSGGIAVIDLTGKANASHTHTTIDITDFPELATVATSGDYNDLINTPTAFVGTDGTTAGAAGLVPAPATTDATKYLMADGTWGFAMTGMVIARYGVSTYAEVLDAYQKGWIIYTRASSNSNPASGNQLRMAFLAYVNDMTKPTEFEFQYYRTLNNHTYNDQCDQVYIYKLKKSGGWSVTVRQAVAKIIPSTGLTYTFVTGNSPTNTIKANLNSETSLGTIGTTEGLYPVGVDSNGHLCVLIPPAS
jgi:hypothetical protein